MLYYLYTNSYLIKISNEADIDLVIEEIVLENLTLKDLIQKHKLMKV